ncbi:MAG: PD-(D/E)XK motif protein [Clostridium sp.]|nr:PD-(D/E)XK motif protein [Bacteroides sp.]MCM1198202.1 PD-(D/E)XK motif protein [Clostridium sp.]
MGTNNQIFKLWSELEIRQHDCMVKKLYCSTLPYRIFATYNCHEQFYGIAISYNNKIDVDFSIFRDLKEIRISVYPDHSYADSCLLVMELMSSCHKETFSLLCENLIFAVCQQESEKAAIQSVVNQLEKWRRLFDKTKNGGLPTAAQQGLFGELHFLYKLLSEDWASMSKTLSWWIGGEAALRDFQGNGWATEVKTISTGNQQKATINGECQLDESFLDALFLYLCSVEVSRYNGNTLNDEVKKIRKLLCTDLPALNIFNEKLILAGYYEEDAEIYKSRCYIIRNEH